MHVHTTIQTHTSTWNKQKPNQQIWMWTPKLAVLNKTTIIVSVFINIWIYYIPVTNSCIVESKTGFIWHTHQNGKWLNIYIYIYNPHTHLTTTKWKKNYEGRTQDQKTKLIKHKRSTALCWQQGS